MRSHLHNEARWLPRQRNQGGKMARAFLVKRTQLDRLLIFTVSLLRNNGFISSHYIIFYCLHHFLLWSCSLKKRPGNLKKEELIKINWQIQLKVLKEFLDSSSLTSDPVGCSVVTFSTVSSNVSLPPSQLKLSLSSCNLLEKLCDVISLYVFQPSDDRVGQEPSFTCRVLTFADPTWCNCLNPGPVYAVHRLVAAPAGERRR